MISVSEQKILLRKQLLSKRSLIRKEDWIERSRLIKNQFLKSPEYQKASFVHCFVSMNEKNEVDTHSLLREMLNQGKKVVVPLTDFKENTLSHSSLETFDNLIENKWGVLEPGKLNPAPEILDIILVPLLGADKHGNRLGYGKGFYDKFLEQSDALKIGLVFKDFILKKIPIEPFDQPLDGLISEEGIFYTKHT